MWVDLQTLTKAIAQNLGDAIFRPNCALCGKVSEKYICPYCDRQLSACKTAEPIQSDPKLPSSILLFAWGVYEHALKQVIARCKYQNHPEIALYLGEKMGEVWQSQTQTRCLKLPVVPIPMFPEKQKARGFNQAEELAKGFCRVTGLPYRPQWLARVKNTLPQMHTKSKEEREANLQQAFQARVPSDRKWHSVILLDDIYTTGATIREAIKALQAQGIRTASVVVLARPSFQTQQARATT
jgi:ComF family protein